MGKKNKKKDEKKGKSSGGNQRTLSGSLALSKMEHVIITKKNKKGKKIELICFPIDKNYFVRGKEGAIYMPVRAIVKDEEDDYGQHGFISQSVDSKVWKDADEEEQAEMNQLPILGGLKDFAFEKGSSSNDAGGSKGKIDENDDLPF